MWTCPKCGGAKSQHGTQCIDCRRNSKINQRITTIERARRDGLTPGAAAKRCGGIGIRSLARWCQDNNRPDLADWLYFDHVNTPARRYTFDETEIALGQGQWVKNRHGIKVWEPGPPRDPRRPITVTLTGGHTVTLPNPRTRRAA